MTQQIAAYGSWRSPISAEMLTTATVGLSEPQFDGDDIYWLESRPLERGRNAIVKLSATGEKQDALPTPLNARSRVNEYGGGSYCVQHGQVYFVLLDDQRVYHLNSRSPAAIPSALTPEGPWRFGNLTLDKNRKRLLAIAEDHSQNGQEEETCIVAISLGDDESEQAPHKLLVGNDFYSSPTLSPDGERIAWLSWNHPNMPWDGCECWLGEFNAAGDIVNQQRIAGGVRESICQPQWSSNGDLYLISDRGSWWNIFRWEGNSLAPVYKEAVEFGTPQWVFGLSTYAFLDADTLLATYTRSGTWHLCTIDLGNGSKQDLPTQLTEISYIKVNDDRAMFIGATSDSFPALYAFDRLRRDINCFARSGTLSVDNDYIAPGEAIEFPLQDSGETGYAFFYAPHNQDFCGEPGNKPPLLVLCHGGPTSATKPALNLKIQYWTSRGFAVADVNYGGSTGYGRHYRERLNGRWGVVDVRDAIDCVDYLTNTGRIDGDKIAIHGSSAGGYTVLAALTFHAIFKAGASLYGVGDLETLAADTHKFESRYMDNLVGPYPEQKAVYRDRSPIHHVDQLNCPVIFLQGLKDKIVPPNQAEAMVAALDAKRIPVAYLTFPEEAHGFRQAPNIRRALEAELYFYSRVFGFEPADMIEPVLIRNADQLTEND
ncbi:MAG: prolyl oligopeptidase family serine peptidase [Cellvibrionaceae bacterium]